MSTLGCVLARTASTRLPGKALIDVCGAHFIERVLDQALAAEQLDNVVLATSDKPTDDLLTAVVEAKGIRVVRGSEQDVLERMIQAANETESDNVVRITGDNLFTDSRLLDATIKVHTANPDSQYTRMENLALGVAGDIIHRSILDDCHERIRLADREYLLFYAFRPDLYHCNVVIPDSSLNAWDISLTVDTETELEGVRAILDAFGGDTPPYPDVIKFCRTASIPSTIVAQGLPIRVPGGKTITYSEYRTKIMKPLIARAHIHSLEGIPYDDL